MNIKKLIEQALLRQMQYGLSDSREKDIIRFASYVIEEANEVQKEVTSGPNRFKPFKPGAPIDNDKLAEEIADVLIHTLNLAAVSGLTAETISDAFYTKLNKNQTRPDHLH